MSAKLRAHLKGGVAAPLVPQAGYMRDGASPFFANWLPSQREPRDDVRIAAHEATARATDLSQNGGYIAGGIDQSVAYVVGTGLNLNSQPDAAALGWSATKASDWARIVERQFELYANRPLECDAAGAKPLGQQTAAAYRMWHATGEMTGLLRWKSIPGARYRTKLLTIPSTRLSRRSQWPDLHQGVRVDADGLPISYLFRASGLTPKDSLETEISARDSAGRPRVIHVFDGLPGQIRGITPLAPVLLTARQEDQLGEATLTAAQIQAILVGAITSDTPSVDLIEALRDSEEQAAKSAADGRPLNGFEAYVSGRAQYYGNVSSIDIGRFGKIAHLFQGDKLELHGAKHPNAGFKDFNRILNRKIARCLGLTYADFTGDYEGETYQSLLHSTAAMWLVVLYRRAFIVAPFLHAIFEAWLEEAIDLGAVPFPGGVDGFIANRAAATRAHWRGRGRPLADPAKIARAHETWKSIGVITDEMISNEMGVDLEDLYEQLARERAMRQQYGLPETVGLTGSKQAAQDEQGDNAAPSAVAAASLQDLP